MYDLPQDPYMLLSVVNMKLRDEYPSLEAMCEDMDIDRDDLCDKLKKAGFEYLPEANRFA